jgi:hypothetical protein
LRGSPSTSPRVRSRSCFPSEIGGLVVGKYLIFDLQHGGFSPDVSQYKMLGYFVQTLPETMTAFDAVWGALAMYAAWKITRLSQLGRHL